MSPAGQAGSGENGTLTAPSGSLVTSWALRSVIEPNAGFGWTWETCAATGTTPVVVAELSSNTGNFRTIGSISASGNISCNGLEIPTSPPANPASGKWYLYLS